MNHPVGQTAATLRNELFELCSFLFFSFCGSVLKSGTIEREEKEEPRGISNRIGAVFGVFVEFESVAVAAF
jgi:hypothetical protein